MRPTTPWNYGLLSVADIKLDKNFTVQKVQVSAYPWTMDKAPIIIKTKGKRMASWQLYNEMAGPIPYSVGYNEGAAPVKEEDIILIPYGCTKLRIAQFPVFDNN